MEAKKRKVPQTVLGLTLAIAVIATLAVSDTTSSQAPERIEQTSGLVAPASSSGVGNPELPENSCDNLQVVVLLDRSGSVVNEGATIVQKYRDQSKKVWQTLHSVSSNYEGFTSGTLWAFAGRTANQSKVLQGKDNNTDGVINEQDMNLADTKVLNKFNEMTQNVYFSSNGNPEHLSNQHFSTGYNPNKESRSHFTRIQFTNWHESLLMAQQTVQETNTPGDQTPNHSIVLMITDGVPNVNDGPNHRWDNFGRGLSPDEQHDGNQNTANHANRARQVVDALRQGQDVKNSSVKYDPVQVYGILIGGGSFGANRMATTFGNGNWFQSADFDSTIGSHILNAIANTCPPEPVLVPGLTGELINPATEAVEGEQVFYTIDLTNSGTASLDNVAIVDAVAVGVAGDDNYSTQGTLAPGMKRRFTFTYDVGASSINETILFNYSGDVADDPSLLVPGSPLNLQGQLSTQLSITLIPRPV